jgi:pimeloyl-ACP methyl ester carboxylesterase
VVSVRQEIAIDGFRLAYDRTGPGTGVPAVVLLHGWPGDRTDYREVVPLVSAAAETRATGLFHDREDFNTPGSSKSFAIMGNTAQDLSWLKITGSGSSRPADLWLCHLP